MLSYTKSEEDYLEAMYIIQRENRLIRVKDIALALDVKMPSVVGAIKSLSEKGLVNQEKYGHIELTSRGEKVAKDVLKRHELLFVFLHGILGISSEIAEQDACKLEHSLSKETQERILKMIEFIESCGPDENMFLKRYKGFIETGKAPGPCPGCLE